MSNQLRDAIYSELSAVTLIDPHTHINALQPASETLADILGYHYYTELAHSAGMPKDQIEEPGLDPKEKVSRLIANLAPVSNTIQYSWFVPRRSDMKIRPFPSGIQVALCVVWSRPAVTSRVSPLSRSRTRIRFLSDSKLARSIEW